MVVKSATVPAPDLSRMFCVPWGIGCQGDSPNRSVAKVIQCLSMFYCHLMPPRTPTDKGHNRSQGQWMHLGCLCVTVTEPSAWLRLVNVRGELATQLMKSILGLIALDRVTRTQCSMAIGPLVEIRSWQTFDVYEIEKEKDEVETRDRDKGKAKDEIKEEEKNLDQRKGR